MSFLRASSPTHSPIRNSVTEETRTLPPGGCRFMKAIHHRPFQERQNAISSRRFLFFALAGSLFGPGWGSGTGLAGQERRDPSEDPKPPVAVRGTVVDNESGDPVVGAAVSLGAGPSGTRGIGTRVTDDDGAFLFREVPSGTYRIYVSTLGYERMRDTLQVNGERDLELILPLSRDPVRLEPIIVRADPVQSPRRDWEGRAEYRSVYLVTREEIKRRNPDDMSDLLNAVPGGIVVPTPPYGYTLLLRGQCLPGVWLDGIEIPYVTSIDQFMSPHDVEAIEVYHGFELPVEFGVNPCGGILIWTRMGEPDPPGTDSSKIFGRFVMAAALSLLALFFAR